MTFPDRVCCLCQNMHGIQSTLYAIANTTEWICVCVCVTGIERNICEEWKAGNTVDSASFVFDSNLMGFNAI